MKSNVSTWSKLRWIHKFAIAVKVFFWILIIAMIWYLASINTDFPTWKQFSNFTINSDNRTNLSIFTRIPDQSTTKTPMKRRVIKVAQNNIQTTRPPNISHSIGVNLTTRPIKKKAYPYIIFPKQPNRLDDNFPPEILNEVELNPTEAKSLKKIVYWTDSYGDKFFGLGFGQAPFLIGKCQYSNCFTTAKKDRFPPNEVDAIVWHFRATEKTLPSVRLPKARYIFFMAESASYLFGNIDQYNGVFDLTFNYRTDSDLPDPYNIVAQKDVLDERYARYTNFSSGKTQMAAWFVSNCHAISGRNKLVSTLQRYIKVDVYGNCGPNKCPRAREASCYEMAAKKYFFYLSFENSLCKDYITEKFYNILRYDIVPVVFGYGPYWKHAPPHSYIDVFDFTSVENLAKYLVHLSKSSNEYNEYFKWKTYYFVLPMYTRRLYSLCKMCEILNTQTVANGTRYNLRDWFVRQSNCKNGESDSPISNFIRGENLTVSYNEFRSKDNLD